MGTRCLTEFVEDGEVIATMYRQLDGYPEGHGKGLMDILRGKRIVNGIGQGDSLKNAFNGMGCLAAAVVAEFKDDIGGIYLIKSGERECGEEFIYRIDDYNGFPRIETINVSSGEKSFWSAVEQSSVCKFCGR